MAVECPYCETATGDMDLLHDHLGDAQRCVHQGRPRRPRPLIDAALKK